MSLSLGLTVDPKTETWWKEQSADAQAAFAVDPKPLPVVAAQFNAWYRGQDIEKVWAQGANFDFPLWEEAARIAGHGAPWKFWATRDTRTVYDLFDFDTRTVQRQRVHHNALDDTKHQVALVAAALRKGRAPVKEDIFA